MKSIVCEQPGRLTVVDVEAPIYKEKNALVRIDRVGICGTDYHAFNGRQPYFSYPRILGHELGGTIIEIGSNAFGLNVGDKVTIIPYQSCETCKACRSGKPNCCSHLNVIGVHSDGGMQEVIRVPVETLIQTNDLTSDAAAIVECLSIGAHAVRRGNVKSGETIVVIGAGPIGLAVMKFSSLAGARVIAVDVNVNRLQFCQQWIPGVETVNAQESGLDSVEKLTQGNFADVVFDATGNINSMAQSLRYASHGGKLVFVGLVQGDVALDDAEFHKRELTLLSSRNATREDFHDVIQAIQDGHVDVDMFVNTRAHFEELPGLIERWSKPESGVIKAILEF